jgi:hypothetical protein
MTNLVEQYGRYGVVDNGKTGGVHTSVEVLSDGTTKTIGTHNTLDRASLTARALHEYTRSKVEDEPADDANADSASPMTKVFGFSVLGFTFTVSR